MIGLRVLVSAASPRLVDRVWQGVRELGADVVVVDLHSLPDQIGEGVEVLVVDRASPDWLRSTARAVEQRPLLRPLLIGDVVGPDEFLAAVSAGIVGFCPRNATVGAIERSICSIAESGVAIPRAFAKPLVDLARRGRMVRTAVGDVAITDREWETLQLLVQRRSTSEIAESLFVSEGTVRSHASTLMKKLGAADRDDLVALVLRGQADPPS